MPFWISKTQVCLAGAEAWCLPGIHTIIEGNHPIEPFSYGIGQGQPLASNPEAEVLKYNAKC